MKYRLKQDLPGYPAGLVFWENSRGGFDFLPVQEHGYSIGEFLLGVNLDDEEWFEKIDEKSIVLPTHVSYTGDGVATTLASLVGAVQVLAKQAGIEVEIR